MSQVQKGTKYTGVDCVNRGDGSTVVVAGTDSILRIINTATDEHNDIDFSPYCLTRVVLSADRKYLFAGMSIHFIRYKSHPLEPLNDYL